MNEWRRPSDGPRRGLQDQNMMCKVFGVLPDEKDGGRRGEEEDPQRGKMGSQPRLGERQLTTARCPRSG